MNAPHRAKTAGRLSEATAAPSLDAGRPGVLGDTPAHAGPAPRGGRPARQHQRHLVHLAGAGPGRRAVGRRAEPHRRRADADRRRARAPVPAGPGPAAGGPLQGETEGVSPRLQRVLDAMDPSPAMIKTATWDIIAWNRAAAVVLTDYGDLPPEERNMLRRMFGDARVAPRSAPTGSMSPGSWSTPSAPMRRGGGARLRDQPTGRRTDPDQSRVQATCGWRTTCSRTAMAPSTCAIRS
jgi:hypothetical protein